MEWGQGGGEHTTRAERDETRTRHGTTVCLRPLHTPLYCSASTSCTLMSMQLTQLEEQRKPTLTSLPSPLALNSPRPQSCHFLCPHAQQITSSCTEEGESVREEPLHGPSIKSAASYSRQSVSSPLLSSTFSNQAPPTRAMEGAIFQAAESKGQVSVLILLDIQSIGLVPLP